MSLLYYFSFEKSISNYHINVYFIIYFAHYFIIVLQFEKLCAIISNEIKAERGSTMQRIVQFIKAQPVLVIAFFAAALTVILVPPDTQYAGYVNTRVLIQLFGLMAAVAGVRAIGVFDAAAAMLLRRAGTIRRLGLILTLICYFASMLVTNDVVLLTFVPLTLLLFDRIPDDRSRILIIVLETAAANLGSMLTPVGNPQNLYLYDAFNLSAGTFLRIMLPSGILSLICLILLTLLLPRSACHTSEQKRPPIPKDKAAAYLLLFAVCLATVFRIIPVWSVLAVTAAVSMVFDHSLLKKVDYALLATFVCFFVFVGNIARIEPVRNAIADMLNGRELPVTALLSQFISNVPAAVMLAGFTKNGSALLLGANLGGLGTLIASLASLISFQFYRKAAGAHTGRYFAVFSAVNFGMLAVLLLAAMLLQ